VGVVLVVCVIIRWAPDRLARRTSSNPTRLQGARTGADRTSRLPAPKYRLLPWTDEHVRGGIGLEQLTALVGHPELRLRRAAARAAVGVRRGAFYLNRCIRRRLRAALDCAGRHTRAHEAQVPSRNEACGHGNDDARELGPGHRAERRAAAAFVSGFSERFAQDMLARAPGATVAPAAVSAAGATVAPARR
jgi:hypothetical protein